MIIARKSHLLLWGGGKFAMMSDAWLEVLGCGLLANILELQWACLWSMMCQPQLGPRGDVAPDWIQTLTSPALGWGPRLK